MAIIGQLLQDLVAVIQRGRHQVGGFIAGKAEHDALVARAFVLVVARIDTLGDIQRLPVQVVFKAKVLPMKTGLFVTDAPHRGAHHLFDFLGHTGRPLAVFVDALAADFTRQHDQLRRGQRFAGDPRLGILGQEQIDNRVADLVGDFVGMALGHAFGSEQVVAAHCHTI